MKLATPDSEIEIFGAHESNRFSIAATGKAFKILSDGLYTNKPRAVLRELACNAYDSHVMANKTDVPIEINFPTTFAPFLEVIDHGVGLSHEGVMNLYSTYFKSTKTDSNDVIGALGLGSKSPFSYTLSFSVISYFEGMKRIYSAAVDENFEPSINLMHEEQTSEPNGITIKIPVKKEDIYNKRFQKEAETVFSFFPVLPKFNEKVNIITGVRDGGKLLIQHGNVEVYFNENRARSGYGSSAAREAVVHVVQGVVSYPLSTAEITNIMSFTKENEKPDPELQNDLKFIVRPAVELILRVDIGECDVAASREKLSLDDRTILNIQNHLKGVLSAVADQYQKKYIDGCANLPEALVLCRQEYRGLTGSELFPWKGTQVPGNFYVGYGWMTNNQTYTFPKMTSDGEELVRNLHLHRPRTRRAFNQKTVGWLEQKFIRDDGQISRDNCKLNFQDLSGGRANCKPQWFFNDLKNQQNGRARISVAYNKAFNRNGNVTHKGFEFASHYGVALEDNNVFVFSGSEAAVKKVAQQLGLVWDKTIIRASTLPALPAAPRKKNATGFEDKKFNVAYVDLSTFAPPTDIGPERVGTVLETHEREKGKLKIIVIPTNRDDVYLTRADGMPSVSGARFTATRTIAALARYLRARGKTEKYCFMLVPTASYERVLKKMPVISIQQVLTDAALFYKGISMSTMSLARGSVEHNYLCALQTIQTAGLRLGLKFTPEVAELMKFNSNETDEVRFLDTLHQALWTSGFEVKRYNIFDKIQKMLKIYPMLELFDSRDDLSKLQNVVACNAMARYINEVDNQQANILAVDAEQPTTVSA